MVDMKRRRSVMRLSMLGAVAAAMLKDQPEGERPEGASYPNKTRAEGPTEQQRREAEQRRAAQEEARKRGGYVKQMLRCGICAKRGKERLLASEQGMMRHFMQYHGGKVDES